MSDERLREHFRALRESEEGQAPALGPLLTTEARPPAKWRVAWLLAPAVAIAAALWLVVTPPAPTPVRTAPTVTEWWTTPTDALLDVPGVDLLRDVPAIGADFEPTPLPPRSG